MPSFGKQKGKTHIASSLSQLSLMALYFGATCSMTIHKVEIVEA